MPDLTKKRIIDAATALIEREGLSAFTMRSLGKELGVSAMAIYGYFPSREDVLRAVITQFMASLNTVPIPGERWDDTLRRTMHSIMYTNLAHPEIASISVDPIVGEGGLENHTETIVNLHLAQGMPEEILKPVWAMVDTYLTGFFANAATCRFKHTMPDHDYEVDMEALKAEPAWKRVIATSYTDEAFDRGIEMIIASTRALAAPDPCDWRTPTEG